MYKDIKFGDHLI